MRLEENPQLPLNADTLTLYQVLTRLLRNHSQKVNQLAEGRITATDNAMTAAPTTGQFQVGDFVRNSAPAELGAVSSKYVVLGWVNVTAGSPGTFVQCRALTGN